MLGAIVAPCCCSVGVLLSIALHPCAVSVLGRWTPDIKKQIKQSRLDITGRLAVGHNALCDASSALAAAPPAAEAGPFMAWKRVVLWRIHPCSLQLCFNC